MLITDVFWRNDIIPAKHVHFRSYRMYKEIFLKNAIEILDIFPMYYLMGFHLPTFIMNKLSPVFYAIDKKLQKHGTPNAKNIKLLI